MAKLALEPNQVAVLHKALSLYVTVASELGVPDAYTAEAMLREAPNVQKITVRLAD